MNFFKIIDYIIIFIVIYLLVMIGRWFVLPHLKVFPNIPPQWLWTSVVGVILYIFNAIFHYIIMALIIIYILWIIIRKFVPNFPIPIRRILLRLPPFRPLEQAGILPLMDRVRKVFFSHLPISQRLMNAGEAIGLFLASSTTFIMNKFGMKVPIIPMGGQSADNLQPHKERKLSREEQAKQDAEDREVRESYLQCIEESIIPITPTMTKSEKEANAFRNQQNTLICKIDQMRNYSRILAA